jgi:hypothetical protein
MLGKNKHLYRQIWRFCCLNNFRILGCITIKTLKSTIPKNNVTLAGKYNALLSDYLLIMQ